MYLKIISVKVNVEQFGNFAKKKKVLVMSKVNIVLNMFKQLYTYIKTYNSNMP